MKLEISWSRRILLKDSNSAKMGYGIDLDKVTNKAGVYIFGRQWGTQFEALYIGKAGNLRSRIKSHLNNLQLMQHLRDARSGKRMLLAGTFIPKPGQQLQRSLTLMEKALIRYFLSEGHDLVNKMGVKLRRHQLHFSGDHPKRFFPRDIFLEKAKGE
jgi:hypothetical protein